MDAIIVRRLVIAPNRSSANCCCCWHPGTACTLTRAAKRFYLWKGVWGEGPVAEPASQDGRGSGLMQSRYGRHLEAPPPARARSRWTPIAPERRAAAFLHVWV
eukprot:scaffold1210_cov410-Prasinococcus_capsulatus_cf.AAC.19